MSSKPHELTADEVRARFLGLVRYYIGYWEKEDRRPGTREKLEGLAHSLLAIIDGETALPCFILVPSPHEDDREYNKEQGDDWYQPFPDVDVCDIGGRLHDELFNSPTPTTEPPD